MWTEYCNAKERAEQYVFPIIAMFDGIITEEYKDLKEHYYEENKEQFVKNVKFMLSKIA